MILPAQNPEGILFGEQALQVWMEKKVSAQHSISSTPNTVTAPSDRALGNAESEIRNDSGSNLAETAEPSNSSTRNSESAQNYLRGILQTELSRYLRYPLLARERGWQGTVLVGVTVAPNGALLSTRLLRSSGYALLDEASLSGLNHIRLLPKQFAQQTDTIEVILPILFRLTDNT